MPLPALHGVNSNQKKLFLEIVYNDSLQQCQTSNRCLEQCLSTSFEKKNWQLEFVPNGPNVGPK